MQSSDDDDDLISGLGRQKPSPTHEAEKRVVLEEEDVDVDYISAGIKALDVKKDASMDEEKTTPAATTPVVGEESKAGAEQAVKDSDEQEKK